MVGVPRARSCQRESEEEEERGDEDNSNELYDVLDHVRVVPSLNRSITLGIASWCGRLMAAIISPGRL